MHASEANTTQPAGASPVSTPIASGRHFAGFLLIMAGVMAFGFYAQRGVSSAVQPGQLAGHGAAIQIYLTAGLMDWLLLYYCWAGVHHRGGTLQTLSGGRWRGPRDLLSDIAIAVPFWIVWEGVANLVARLLGSGGARSVVSLLPQSPLEVLLWIGVSITAGICEELAFRGYLQRQFHARTGSLAVAIAAQALVFGIAHSYKGWRQVVVITVVGALDGVLAAWRKNLRANILSHAAVDIWEGWLKFVVSAVLGH